MEGTERAHLAPDHALRMQSRCLGTVGPGQARPASHLQGPQPPEHGFIPAGCNELEAARCGGTQHRLPAATAAKSSLVDDQYAAGVWLGWWQPAQLTCAQVRSGWTLVPPPTWRAAPSCSPVPTACCQSTPLTCCPAAGAGSCARATPVSAARPGVLLLPAAGPGPRGCPGAARR